MPIVLVMVKVYEKWISWAGTCAQSLYLSLIASELDVQPDRAEVSRQLGAKVRFGSTFLSYKSQVGGL